MKVIALCDSPRRKIDDDDNVYMVHMTGKEIANMMGKRSSERNYSDYAEIKLGMEIDISSAFYGVLEFIENIKYMSTFKSRLDSIVSNVEKIKGALHKKNINIKE